MIEQPALLSASTWIDVSCSTVLTRAIRASSSPPSLSR
jgi:hypothetical protein